MVVAYLGFGSPYPCHSTPPLRPPFCPQAAASVESAMMNVAREQAGKADWRANLKNELKGTGGEMGEKSRKKYGCRVVYVLAAVRR